MPSLGTIWAELGLKLTRFDEGLREAEAKIKQVESKFVDLEKIGDRLSSVGQKMTMGLTLPLAGIGAAAFKMSNDFNGAMANVATLIPGNVERVQELKGAVQVMAVDVGKRTGDLADGLYQVISAFGDTADTAKVLEINARAAAAGLATTTDAINLTSAVTKGYGDTSAEAVEKVSDLAFTTVKLGQTTFPELAASIGRVTPLAASLGVSMEDMFGVMATGTGVTGTASEVSTQLRGVLQALMSPTKGMTGLLQKMGFESGQAMLQQLGLKGTIDTIVKASEQAGVPLQEYISQIEGQTLALALAGPQADTFSEKLKAMGEVAGATDEAFKEQTEGVNKAGFKWAQFTVKLEVATQQIGDKLAPVLGQLLDKVYAAITWFTELDEGTQTWIIGIAALVAAIGPALMIIGSMASGLNALPALFAALTGPIGLTVAAIGLLILAAYQIYEHWDGIMAFFSSLWDGIKSTVTITANTVLDFLREWGPLILAVVTGPIGLIVYGVAKHWDEIKAKTTETWNNIKEFLGSAFKWLYDHNYYFKNLVDVIKNAWSLLKETTERIWNGVKSWLDSTWKAIAGTASSIWEGIASILSAVWDKISSALQRTWNSISGAVRTAWGNISQTISNISGEIWQSLSGLASQAWNWGRNLLDNFINGIKSRIAALKSIASEAARAVAGFLGFHSPAKEGPGSDADKWAPNLVRMYAEGIRTGIPDIKAAVIEAASMLNGLRANVAMNVVPAGGGYAPAPAHPVAAAARPTIINLNFTGPINIRDDNDIKLVSRELYKLAQSAQRGSGGR